MLKFGYTFLLAACALFGESTPSAQAIEGRRVFNSSCAVGYCHGLDGRAGRGPRMRDRAWSKNYLFQTIEQGIPGSSMPAWQGRLSPESIAAVVSYIISVSEEQPEAGGGAAHNTRSATTAQDSAGKDLFFDLMRDRNCGVCHRIGDIGAAVAPPFKNLGNVPARTLLAQVTSHSVGESNVSVRLTGGEEFCGVKVADDPVYLRIYDLGGAGPPVLRIIDKHSLVSMTPCRSLSVHASNTETYSLSELQSIIFFLMRKSASE